MNHKPIEDLIFASDGLTNSDREILQNHLAICDDCRLLSHAWEHVTMELHASPLAEPAPGFTNRWQLRMESDRVRQQRRQSLLILAFCMVGAGLLLGVLALLSLPLAGSPLALAMTWISKGWVVISTANVIQDMLAILFKALVNTVSPIWLILVLGVGSLMAVLWAASLRMLMLPRRVVK